MNPLPCAAPRQSMHFGPWTARDHSLPGAAMQSQGGGGVQSRGGRGVTPTGPEVPGAVAQDARSRTSIAPVGCRERAVARTAGQLCSGTPLSHSTAPWPVTLTDRWQVSLATRAEAVGTAFGSKLFRKIQTRLSYE